MAATFVFSRDSMRTLVTPYLARKLLTALVVCSALANLRCGSPTIDARYAGKPLLEMQGNIVGFVEGNYRYPVRASLFWSPNGHLNNASLHQMREDNSVNIYMELPSSFNMSIHRPPRSEWMVSGKGYAVGTVILYEDRLGQRRFVPGKTPILGSTPSRVIFYSPREIPAQASPFKTSIGPGMMDLVLPLPCGVVKSPDVPQGEAAGCPLGKIGAACNRDEDCGAGECLKSLGSLPLRNGYCVRRSMTSCQPVGALGFGVAFKDKKGKEDFRSYWVKSCSRELDCRYDEGYRCDPFAHACLPNPRVVLELTEGLDLEPYCDRESDKALGEDASMDPGAADSDFTNSSAYDDRL